MSSIHNSFQCTLTTPSEEEFAKLETNNEWIIEVGNFKFDLE